MTHSELTVAFSMDLPVYLILYTGVGIVGVLELTIFCTYHTIFNRKRPRPKLRFYAYIKCLYKSPIIGLIMMMIPIGFIMSILSVFMIGEFYDFSLKIRNKTIFE